MPRQATPASTRRAMSKLRHSVSPVLRSATAKTSLICNGETSTGRRSHFGKKTSAKIIYTSRLGLLHSKIHPAIHWRLSDELIASISLILSLFDNQFEYSLSF
jgi:hypothetical protein